jgi:uncharacterized protein YecA (UPF0149 family)
MPSIKKVDFTKELATPIISEKKPSRNDDCPCGSKTGNGQPKKYKYCCGSGVKINH